MRSDEKSSCRSTNKQPTHTTVRPVVPSGPNRVSCHRTPTTSRTSPHAPTTPQGGCTSRNQPLPAADSPVSPPTEHPTPTLAGHGLLTDLRRQALLRKEVIQPHLPVRLPCYDFVPIASPTFDGSLHKGWATGFGCCRLS